MLPKLSDEPLIRIVDEHEEEDGSITLTLEGPQEVFDVLAQKYGTKDFGDAFVRDAINYAISMNEEDNNYENTNDA